jgi:4-hydroxy 2-oxovalerate aldolase
MCVNQITFLDCTLRDGGYYTDWDFNLDKTKKLVEELNEAGVNIIEIGYKAPYSRGKYYGLFRNCNEDYLTFISKKDQAEYSFMIDVKEFVKETAVDFSLLDKYIKAADKSVFSWVRLASYVPTIWAIPTLTDYFHKKGYKVTFNLMGGSLLSDAEIKAALNKATDASVDVFYIADSFGAFYPEDIRRLIRFIKSKYSGKIGIHTHENQGLAYINTLIAIEEGVDFVDGTVCGMGRGAGNLRTEQFLLGYSQKYVDNIYNSSALLPSIVSFIEPLKDKYKWGFHYSYMFSGLMNIHPTYCQQLSNGDRYTSEETHSILKNIPVEKRSKYSRDVLDKAVEGVINIEAETFSPDALNVFDLSLLQSDTILIIARGNQASNNMTGLINLVERKNIPVLECNLTGFLPNKMHRFLVILNQNKIKKYLEMTEYPEVYLITGQPVRQGNGASQRAFFPVTLGTLEISGEKLTIPDYDAGLYAIALAMKAGVKNILLAGFDGFDDPDINAGKDLYFSQFVAMVEKLGISLLLVTPSKYKSIPQSSLYII